eukprot:CAMPEP_0119333296 /NCGR_PEP_ID=MMETSP1333-20130426/84819_1 /TAXON_ID=418940 /ORGANISM="Scyphosphaera apsteinii, Strain RCC1455" /LENGTH=515 /DNA_ID=CAMNT_0007343333 /DNA_START=18 /DNA_END=1565 /DNA_ORIENTATION=+
MDRSMFPPSATRLAVSRTESFDAMRTDESSPVPPSACKLHTPNAPPEAPQRPLRSIMSLASTSSASMDSELSGAATHNRSIRYLRMAGGDLDSPAVQRNNEALSERRVPSCPQKEGSKVSKRHSNLVPSTDETEEIRPRTLDMSDVDPLNGLSLSPMNMSSPQQMHLQNSKEGRNSGSLANAEARCKRPKIHHEGPQSIAELFTRSLSSGPEMGPPGAVPPPLQHHNSMADTKMLYSRTETDPNFAFEGHFIWLRRLGSGSFSDVYAVEHKERPGERFAIKCSKREFHSKRERAEYLREVELANDMPAHPNVVEYYRAWQDACFFYVQMELCVETLRNLMQREQDALRMPTADHRVWEMVRHIARGLAHIHSYNVIHCDLKPDNILISTGGLYKIGDLGHAIALKAWDEQEGDACYLSRDLLECKPSTSADIFSFGIMLFELKSGETLPGSGERWDFLRNGNVPAPVGCSVPMAEMIGRMMDPLPEARSTAEDIMQMSCEAVTAMTMAAVAAVGY